MKEIGEGGREKRLALINRDNPPTNHITPIIIGIACTYLLQTVR